MRIQEGQIQARNHASSGAKWTVSEVMDGMKSLATDPGSMKGKAKKYLELRAAGKGLKLGLPFEVALLKASICALRGVGGTAAAQLLFSGIQDRICDMCSDTVRPMATSKVSFDPDLSAGYSTANAQIAAQASTTLYSDKPTLFKNMANQGFKPLEGGLHECKMTSARAFTASREDVAVVSFCGTADLVDFVKDARLCKVDAGQKYSGKVHDGFEKQLDSVWPQIQKSIVKARAENPNRPVMFTGHSLGGALDLLAADRAQKEGLLDNPPTTNGQPAATLHTFGQPRVGGEDYARAFTKNMGDVPYYREVFRNDPVTQVPPEGTGFAHIASAKVIYHDGAGTSQVDVDETDSRLQTLAQGLSLADVANLLTQTGANVTDHNEINYQVSTSRNHGVELS